ncbi:hypothetical protein LF1_01290 [Rubripirellula obstinata]|uniref:Aerotolerance regulator N-terminal domain-containing protein n=1 Tax=Rubripirellula obstinata TaxID=406547 RepID=A0A5B1CBN3_9BACT|nr:BatA domain-containing protein [Rubripirellula obstinata]KAA1257641.1 hypothetical protein LF1_01290 [Rubripirellula obstinata]
MTLINGLLALGGLAFTIPLAIHLFYRSRFRTVDWGAMHLIEGMMRTNRRRIQWLNLLLLLVRCCVPILLAFCLARPLLTGFQALPGDAAQSVVIAIDDSRSMGFATSAGRVRMDDAHDAIDLVLDSLTRRDEIILIRSSDPSSPITRIGPATARSSIDATKPHSGPVDLAGLIQSASAAAKQASQPNPRVMVVSDFQTNMIDDASLTRLQSFAESVSDQGTKFEFLNIAADQSADQQANVSVESITMESAAAVVERQAVFLARIRNHGDDPIEAANVVWSVNGKRESSKPITVQPRSFASVKFVRTFDTPSPVAITASIEFADSLAADNQRTLAVDVIEQVNVWLVDDANKSRFLQVALSPFAFSGSPLTDPVKTTRISTADLQTKLPVSDPDVIVLAGLTEPTSNLRQIIGDYVHNGGSVILFDQAGLDQKRLNSSWGTAADSFQMPAELGESIGSDSPDGDLFAIAGRNADYSPWALFGDTSRDLFSDVQVSSYRQLRLRSGELTTTLVSLESGDPLIVMSDRGLGRIVQFAIAADASGSTLPLRPVFVPMIQQMVLDLAGSNQSMNFNVGETLVLATSDLMPPDQENAKQAAFYFTRPGQDDRLISPQELDGRSVLAVSNTSKPGVYRFRSVVKESSIAKQSIRVMEVLPSESISRGVDPARVQNAADAIGATVYGEPKSLIEDDQTGRYGREIWRWILSALLFAMIAELWISQRLGQHSSGQRSTGQQVETA